MPPVNQETILVALPIADPRNYLNLLTCSARVEGIIYDELRDDACISLLDDVVEGETETFPNTLVRLFSINN